jgi:hypothetical protein
MAPLTAASDERTHQALLDQLDIYKIHKSFRNPHWKPPQRRNKNVKQIIADATRKEASVMATQNNSGASTPALSHTEGATPAGRPPNIALLAADWPLRTAMAQALLPRSRTSRAPRASTRVARDGTATLQGCRRRTRIPRRGYDTTIRRCSGPSGRCRRTSLKAI